MKRTKLNLNNTSIMNTDEFATLEALLPIELKSVFIGIMLGDGSLYRSSPTSNVRFEISFGQKYELFALYLGDLFKELMSNPVKTLEIKGKTKTYTPRPARIRARANYRLKTKSLPLFVPYYNIFYSYNEDLNKYIKIVPENIIEFMDPIVLAYLIMTPWPAAQGAKADGNFDKGRNRVRIYTNSYKKEEVERLALAINDKFNIYTGVLHDRNNQWILTIGAKNLTLLRDIVSKYFHDSMKYRIGL